MMQHQVVFSGLWFLRLLSLRLFSVVVEMPKRKYPFYHAITRSANVLLLRRSPPDCPLAVVVPLFKEEIHRPTSSSIVSAELQRSDLNGVTSLVFKLRLHVNGEIDGLAITLNHEQIEWLNDVLCKIDNPPKKNPLRDGLAIHINPTHVDITQECNVGIQTASKVRLPTHAAKALVGCLERVLFIIDHHDKPGFIKTILTYMTFEAIKRYTVASEDELIERLQSKDYTAGVVDMLMGNTKWEMAKQFSTVCHALGVPPEERRAEFNESALIIFLHGFATHFEHYNPIMSRHFQAIALTNDVTTQF